MPVGADELNKIVIDYLNKKGYTRTEAVLRLEAARSQSAGPAQSQSGEPGDVHLDGSPQSYRHAYQILRSWIESSLDIYKPELRKILFPIFLHSYFDLVSKGATIQAQEYFETFKPDHVDLHGHDLREVSAVVLASHIDENQLAVLYRTAKYRLSMSRITFDLMLHFLFENEAEGGAIVMRLLNQYIEINIVSGKPGRANASFEGISGHNIPQIDEINGGQPLRLGEFPMEKEMHADVELELADEDERAAQLLKQTQIPATSGFSLLQDFKRRTEFVSDSDQPTRDNVPYPPYKGVDVRTEVEALKDARKRLVIGPQAALPSICMYTFHNTHDNLHCADFSNDASMVACGFAESYVRVWSLKDKSRGMDSVIKSSSKRMVGHSGPVYGVSFSADNRYLLSCSEDRSTRLWSLDTQTALVAYKGHNQPVWDVAFGPFGHYFATASHDMTARLWSCDHIYPLRIFAGHLSDVDVVTFHPNSTYILTGSSDKTCRIWDISRGNSVRVLTGHNAPISASTFSTDGKMVASGGEDGEIILWDIASGRCIKSMKGHAKRPIYSLSFSKEDSVLVSGSADATVRIWDVKKSIVDADSHTLANVEEAVGTTRTTNTVPIATTKERKESLQT